MDEQSERGFSGESAMKVSVERLPGNQAVLEVDLDAVAVGEAMQRAFAKLVKTINVPGFRRGKAPRQLFERYVGKQMLYDEAVEQLAPVSYARAVDEADLEPLEQPEVDILEFGEGQGFKYRATVLVKPEAKLNDYRSIAVPVEPVPVTEEAVQELVAGLLENQAFLEPAGAGAELGPGMLATLEVRKVDSQGAAGPEAEQHTLDLSGTQVLEGEQAQLAGARVGETRIIGARMAAGDGETSGSTDQQWAVTVTGLVRKRLPEFNDEFAGSLGRDETAEELLERLRERLRLLSEERARHSQLDQVAERLLAQTEVDIPEVMVENRLGSAIREYRSTLEAQGISLERDLAFTGRRIADLAGELLLPVRRAIKLDLALEAVARAEGLQATGEDMEQAARHFAPAAGSSPWAEAGRRAWLRNTVLRRKAMHLLSRLAEENAARKEVAGEGEDAI